MPQLRVCMLQRRLKIPHADAAKYIYIYIYIYLYIYFFFCKERERKKKDREKASAEPSRRLWREVAACDLRLQMCSKGSDCQLSPPREAQHSRRLRSPSLRHRHPLLEEEADWGKELGVSSSSIYESCLL